MSPYIDWLTVLGFVAGNVITTFLVQRKSRRTIAHLEARLAALVENPELSRARTAGGRVGVVVSGVCGEDLKIGAAVRVGIDGQFYNLATECKNEAAT